MSKLVVRSIELLLRHLIENINSIGGHGRKVGGKLFFFIKWRQLRPLVLFRGTTFRGSFIETDILAAFFYFSTDSDALFRKRETYFRRCMNFTRVGKSDFLFCPRKIKNRTFFSFLSLSLSVAINNINRDISPAPSSKRNQTSTLRPTLIITRLRRND